MRRYLVIHHRSSSKKESERVERRITKGLPYEVFANELMDYEPFVKYLQENGSHFTNKLADYCISLHKERSHRSAESLLESLESSHVKLPKDVTLGDFTYLVNTKYKNHPDAVAKALEQLKDQPYQGFIFNRWLADHIGMGQSIPWEEFI